MSEANEVERRVRRKLQDVDMQKSGTKLACPHCKKEQDEVVDDYVTPGKIGHESSCDDLCEHCDKPFSVTRLESGDFDVLSEVSDDIDT